MSTDKRSIDEQTLAALLEGRLTDEERAKVLAAVADDEHALEVLGGAAEVLRELQEGRDREREDGGGEGGGAAGGACPVPFPEPPGKSDAAPRRSSWLLPLAAALGALGIALAVWLASGVREAAVEERVAALPSGEELASALGAGWTTAPWSEMRGASVVVSEPSRAFRLGARAVDLEAALRARDREAARFVAAQLHRLVEEVDGAEPLAFSWSGVVDLLGEEGEEIELERSVDAAQALTRELTEPLHYRAGAWAEQGRLTLIAGERPADDWFREARALRAGSVSSALDRALAAISPEQGLDDLEASLTTIFVELGNGNATLE